MSITSMFIWKCAKVVENRPEFHHLSELEGETFPLQYGLLGVSENIEKTERKLELNLLRYSSNSFCDKLWTASMSRVIVLSKDKPCPFPHTQLGKSNVNK